ncbi:MAG: hypothetical protein FJ313_07560 [Gemmatimonadetes bacterium]|nr:hypothetical protein [Gemmatimonadota bacterium]
MLGFPPDAELWSWDFNAIELMNGPRVIFRNPPGALAGALFDDWMGFHNLGHRIVALGSSDTHGEEGPGEVRTYFASPTDDPVSFDGQDLVDALVAGRAVVSAGAFIRLTAGGQAGPGDMIGAGGGTVDVAIRVEAPPAVDVAYVTVFRNCDQVASVLATDPHGVVKLDVTVPVAVTQDSHVVVAAFGAETMPPGLVQYSPAGRPRGVTNPVFVDHDGDGAFTPPGVKSCVYDLAPPDA